MRHGRGGGWGDEGSKSRPVGGGGGAAPLEAPWWRCTTLATHGSRPLTAPRRRSHTPPHGHSPKKLQLLHCFCTQLHSFPSVIKSPGILRTFYRNSINSSPLWLAPSESEKNSKNKGDEFIWGGAVGLVCRSPPDDSIRFDCPPALRSANAHTPPSRAGAQLMLSPQPCSRSFSAAECCRGGVHVGALRRCTPQYHRHGLFGKKAPLLQHPSVNLVFRC
jgi:hypothetical protein